MPRRCLLILCAALLLVTFIADLPLTVSVKAAKKTSGKKSKVKGSVKSKRKRKGFSGKSSAQNEEMPKDLSSKRSACTSDQCKARVQEQKKLAKKQV